MVVRVRDLETKRFNELFNQESLFIIQGLPGKGKRAFLKNLLKIVPSDYEIHNIKCKNLLFEDLIQNEIKKLVISTKKRIIILRNLDDIDNFSFASKWIASLKNENQIKWIILTKKTLDLPKLNRIDKITFTLTGLSVEESRGEVDDLNIKTKIAIKENKWHKAKEIETTRNNLIKEENYTRLLPSSMLTLAIIEFKLENSHITKSLCQHVIDNFKATWQELAAYKILGMLPQEDFSFIQASQRLEQLDLNLTVNDKSNLDQFFSTLQIKQPREYLIVTNAGNKQATLEELAQFSQKRFDLYINFITNEFHEKTLGNLYFGHGTILHTLFETLIKSPGKTFSKDELYRIAWKGDYHPLAHDPKIYFMINRLRKLIEPTSTYRYILSSDLGYSFNQQSNFCIIQRSKPQTSTYLNPRQRTLLTILSSEQYISNIEYRRKFQVSNATAYRDLKELSDRGLLTQEGEGRGAKYRQKEV